MKRIHGIKGVSGRARAMLRLAIGYRETKHSSRLGKEVSFPAKLDHFRLVKKSVDGRSWVMDERAGQLGERPTEVEVVFGSDVASDVLDYSLKAWRGGKLHCYGDGETASRLVGPNTLQRRELECDPSTCPIYNKVDERGIKRNLCKPGVQLSFVIPAVGAEPAVFRTTSWNSLKLLIGSLDRLRQATSELIAGVPVTLRLQRQRVQREGAPPTDAQIVDFFFDFDIAGQIAADRARLLGMARGTPRVAVERLEETPEDWQDFAGEFAPGGDAEAPQSDSSVESGPEAAQGPDASKGPPAASGDAPELPAPPFEDDDLDPNRAGW